MYWSGYAAALLTTVLWGSSFVVNKLLLGELTPLAVQVLRFSLGAVASLVLFALVGQGQPLLPVGVVLVVLGIVLSSRAPRPSTLAGARRPAMPSR